MSRGRRMKHPQNLREAIERYRKGDKVRAIVKSTGISQGALYRYVSLAGIPRRNRRVDHEKVVELYQSGTPVLEIAYQMKISLSTLYHILHSHGINLRAQEED